MIPAAIYARFSTDKQDARSIDDQLPRCREFAERNGYEIVAEYSDAAMSGTHAERPQLVRMIEESASKRRPFRAVIVDDLSRLSRDIGDTHAIVFGALAGAGVKLLDTTGLDSEHDSAEMTITMRSVINREYIRAVSKQTHRGLEGRALAGFSTGGSLYGYRTVVEPNPRDPEHPRKSWLIDETEAAIVRRIFALVDGGTGHRTIADTFNREGIAAPRNNGRGGKHGGGWSHVTVRSILVNEKYKGTWVWNATKWTRTPGKATRRRVNRPEADRVVREMPELAIIDRATWDQTQARMAKRKHGDERTTRQGARVYLTSGLLRCGVCGGPLSVRSAKFKAGVRYVNFGCTAHSSRGGSVCTNTNTISEKKITDALIEALRDLLTGPEISEAFARAFERRVGERSKAAKPADLHRELEAARRRVANATRLLIEDPDDRDIRAQRDLDKAEVRKLEAAAAELAGTKPRALPDRKVLGAAVGRLLDVLASQAPERGREILARCVGALTVTPKIKGPNRFQVVGSVDLVALAAGAANGSSGGRRSNPRHVDRQAFSAERVRRVVSIGGCPRHAQSFVGLVQVNPDLAAHYS